MITLATKDSKSDLPEIPSFDCINRSEVKNLGRELIYLLSQNKSLDGLSDTQIKIMTELNLIAAGKSGFVWNFEPFIGRGLLLFSDFDSHRHEHEYIWLRKKQDSVSWQFTDTVGLYHNMKVLDLGCGSGLNAIKLALVCSEVTAVEINPRAYKLACLNACLNGLDNIAFVCRDWKNYQNRDFDIIFSQPPFDPLFKDSRNAYAFAGGGRYGLEFTLEIINSYQPTIAGRKLLIYTHAFEQSGRPIFLDMIGAELEDGVEFSYQKIRTMPIPAWWIKYKQRHNIDTQISLPEDWKNFDGVGAYFLQIAKSD